MKEEGQMLVDRYQAEDVFARVPQMVQRIDPVLKELDQLLEDDQLYQQVRADFAKRSRWTKVAWAALHPGGSHPASARSLAPASVELSRNRRAGGPEPDPALVLPSVLGPGAR